MSCVEGRVSSRMGFHQGWSLRVGAVKVGFVKGRRQWWVRQEWVQESLKRCSREMRVGESGSKIWGNIIF